VFDLSTYCCDEMIRIRDANPSKMQSLDPVFHMYNNITVTTNRPSEDYSHTSYFSYIYKISISCITTWGSQAWNIKNNHKINRVYAFESIAPSKATIYVHSTIFPSSSIWIRHHIHHHFLRWILPVCKCLQVNLQNSMITQCYVCY